MAYLITFKNDYFDVVTGEVIQLVCEEVYETYEEAYSRCFHLDCSSCNGDEYYDFKINGKSIDL